jgi:hypothetical protein
MDLETAKKFFWSLFTVNLTQTLIWGGIFLTFVGAIFGNTIDAWHLIPIGTGEALLKTGSAILGAGVFAVILKSSQFTSLFQKHIMDVLYNPANMADKSVLKEKWILLTNEMLKQVLPKAHYDATNQIEKQFLNSELDYHFENHEITYDIQIDASTNIATIKNTTRSTIVLSPNTDEPMFEQVFQNDGKSKLLKLFLNNENINQPDLFIIDSENPNNQILKFPFKKYGIISSQNEDTKITLERIIENKQNLADDPCLLTFIKRYSKGFVVKAKVSEGYKIIFDNFSFVDVTKDRYQKDDGDSYERWQLAKPDELLLPNDGYVIVIIKENL